MKKDNNFDHQHYVPEGHTDPTSAVVGTINFSTELLNEQEVSGKTRLNIKSIGELKIEVYSNEGQVPHFHLYNSDKSFESCICIYSANYFSHGGKYRDKLSNKQCEILNDYLRQPSKALASLSVWQQILILWSIFNPECKFPDKRKVLTQPDYSNMVDYRDN